MDSLLYEHPQNKSTYIHGAFALLIGFLIVAVCCWGFAPGIKNMLTWNEGMANSPLGIGSSGAAQLNTWPVAHGSIALGSLSPTSANQRYLDQSQVNFQPSVSDMTSVDGVVAVAGDSPYRNIIPGASGFLGGPQAPLFSGPPSDPGLQGHAYLKAVDAAQQAQAAGLGQAGQEAAVAAESMYGGYEGASGGNKIVFSSFGKTGFSDQELSALL